MKNTRQTDTQDTNVIPVVFRKWQEPGEDEVVFALFPTLPSDNYGHYCTAYEHVGQHGPADYFVCIRLSRPATAKESEPLVQELERIGYRLHVIQRATWAMHDERRATVKRIHTATICGDQQP